MVESVVLSKLVSESTNEDDLLKALESFIDIYKKKKQKNQEEFIPLSLFTDRNLGSLEVIVKYMKENLSLSYAKIALLLNRDQRTIWSTYSKAIIKHKHQFIIKNNEYVVPYTIFSDRNQGPLEALVCYLKDNLNLSFNQISKFTKRDYKTVWLSYKNGKNHDK